MFDFMLRSDVREVRFEIEDFQSKLGVRSCG